MQQHWHEWALIPLMVLPRCRSSSPRGGGATHTNFPRTSHSRPFPYPSPPLPDSFTPAIQVAPGGRVIWRSAAFVPPYARWIEEAGFDVRCIQRADQGFMVRPAERPTGALLAVVTVPWFGCQAGMHWCSTRA